MASCLKYLLKRFPATAEEVILSRSFPFPVTRQDAISSPLGGHRRWKTRLGDDYILLWSAWVANAMTLRCEAKTQLTQHPSECSTLLSQIRHVKAINHCDWPLSKAPFQVLILPDVWCESLSCVGLPRQLIRYSSGVLPDSPWMMLFYGLWGGVK